MAEVIPQPVRVHTRADLLAARLIIW
jgi:hypothetical protein